MVGRNMKNWRLDGVEEKDKKKFICKCLQEYIDEVERMRDEVLEIHYGEILDTADLYKEIIKILENSE